MKVYLIGYMGSGKSTVGQLLAKRLKLDFIDFDRYIEKEEGKAIAEIFDSGKEDNFRRLEHTYLKKLLPRDNVVISLGGGTPCFHNNIELINNNGISVYLDIDVDTLAQRLSKAKNKRPLIQGLNEMELKMFIQTNLERRLAYYTRANFTVSAKDIAAEEILLLIEKLLRKK